METSTLSKVYKSMKPVWNQENIHNIIDSINYENIYKVTV